MKKPFNPVRIPPHVFSSLLNDLRDAAAKGGMCQNLRERLNRTLQGYIVPDHPHTRGVDNSAQNDYAKAFLSRPLSPAEQQIFNAWRATERSKVDVEDLLTPEQREAFDLLQYDRQQKEMEWLAANQQAKDVTFKANGQFPDGFQRTRECASKYLMYGWQERASDKAESIEKTNIKRANTMKQVLASKEETMTRVRDDLKINVPEKMKVLCVHCLDDYCDENLCLGVCCGTPMVQVSYLLYHTRLREGWTKDLMRAWAKQNGKPL